MAWQFTNVMVTARARNGSAIKDMVGVTAQVMEDGQVKPGPAGTAVVSVLSSNGRSRQGEMRFRAGNAEYVRNPVALKDNPVQVNLVLTGQQGELAAFSGSFDPPRE